MPSNHDPRKDPQAGDITAYSSDETTSIFRVTTRDGRVVYYTQTTNGKTDEHDTLVEDWVAGSETDEVLHVAAAEAREATQPTAEEVIEAAENACLFADYWLRVAGELKEENPVRDALALIARYKEANGGTNT